MRGNTPHRRSSIWDYVISIITHSLMLSEKAKGKQRAAEPPDDDYDAGQLPVTEPERDTPRDLLIRFTEGVPDLNLTVNKLDSARDVKRHVRLSAHLSGPWLIGILDTRSSTRATQPSSKTHSFGSFTYKRYS